ncbi:MAG: hypothetical protein F6K23_39315 [Okeania sp. SIO2C9]|uniref:hypothetical protein n=1 Tax=Okeania sp. SIO2C9 TaxID=2607791 RepID=UPI0013C16579|nr:hypothetical protein [Okeania sp. SIO2C9]NEQ78514.1 hypothetical protein [Okeania sp. SIO2C9]
MATTEGWEFTQKIIKVGFNRDVRKYFRDIKSDSRRDNGRAVLKNSLLIKDNDSALQVLNKQMYFYLGLKDNRQAIATIPEYWDVKVGAHRPQLAIIYRPTLNREEYTGNYPIYIPQYNGHKNPKLPIFKKGNWHGILYLKDNSRLVINGVSATEAERVIKILQRYIISDYLPGVLKITQLKNAPYHEFEVQPIRADYYSRGRKNAQPDWRCYYN